MRGPKTPVDIANMAKCATIDIIGKWGFGVDMAAVPTLRDTDCNSLVQVRANRGCIQSHADREGHSK